MAECPAYLRLWLPSSGLEKEEEKQEEKEVRKGCNDLHGVVSPLQRSLASATQGLLLKSTPTPLLQFHYILVNVSVSFPETKAPGVINVRCVYFGPQFGGFRPLVTSHFGTYDDPTHHDENMIPFNDTSPLIELLPTRSCLLKAPSIPTASQSESQAFSSWVIRDSSYSNREWTGRGRETGRLELPGFGAVPFTAHYHDSNMSWPL